MKQNFKNKEEISKSAKELLHSMPLFVNETFAINAVVRFRVLKSWQSSADHCKSLPYTYILAQYSRCSPFNCVKDEK